MVAVGADALRGDLARNAPFGIDVVGTVNLPAADPDQHEVVARVRVKAVWGALRQEDALVRPYIRLAVIAEIEGRLTLQHEEQVIFDVVPVHRVLAAVGIDLGMDPEVRRRAEQVHSRAAVEQR